MIALIICHRCYSWGYDSSGYSWGHDSSATLSTRKIELKNTKIHFGYDSRDITVESSNENYVDALEIAPWEPIKQQKNENQE